MVSDVSNLLRCSVFFLISLSQIVFTLSVFASRVKTVSEEQTASELKLSWQEDAGAETTKYWLSGSGSSTWQEFKIGILRIASCIHIQKKLYARPVSSLLSNLQGVHGESDPKAVFVLRPEQLGLALVLADNQALVEEERLLHLHARPPSHLR